MSTPTTQVERRFVEHLPHTTYEYVITDGAYLKLEGRNNIVTRSDGVEFVCTDGQLARYIADGAWQEVE